MREGQRERVGKQMKTTMDSWCLVASDQPPIALFPCSDNISYLIHSSPHTLCYCAQVGRHVREGRITLSGCHSNSASRNKAAGCVRQRNRKSSTCVLFLFSFLAKLTLNKWPELVIQNRWKDKRLKHSTDAHS